MEFYNYFSGSQPSPQKTISSIEYNSINIFPKYSFLELQLQKRQYFSHLISQAYIVGWPRKLITIYTTVSIVKNIPQFTRRRATPQMRVLHLQPCHLLGKKGERNGGKNARNSFYFCFTRHGCWALAYNEKLSP